MMTGGLIMSKSVLAALVIYGERLEVVSQTFTGVAVIGYIIAGLGIWQTVVKRKCNMYSLYHFFF
jgi:hypothetical protein